MKMERDGDVMIIMTRPDGRRIEWNVKTIYTRTKYKIVKDVFDQINGYWAGLPPQRQEKIWNIYAQIYEAISEIFEHNRRIQEVSRLVKELYEEHKIDAMEMWLQNHGNIKVPDSIKDNHRGYNADRTYVREDYAGLSVLVVLMRLMVPIWGEYMIHIKGGVESAYREHDAIVLLPPSIMHSAPIKRLMLYINTYIENIDFSVSAIIDGLGSEDMPMWALANVLVKRIAIGSLSMGNDEGNLITNTTSFLTQTLTDMDKKFGGRVRDKVPKDSDRDDGMSLLDTYRSREKKPYGDIANYGIAAMFPDILARQVEETLDMQRLDDCLYFIRKIDNFIPNKFQVWIAQLIMDRVIPARGLLTIERPDMLNVIAIAQAVLWKWEMPEMAALLTVGASEDDSDIYYAGGDKIRLPADILDRFNVLYPYKEGMGRAEGVKPGNVGVNAVEIMTKEVLKGNWVFEGPDALAGNLKNYLDAKNRMAAPPNLATLIAKMVIKIKEQPRRRAS